MHRKLRILLDMRDKSSDKKTFAMPKSDFLAICRTHGYRTEVEARAMFNWDYVEEKPSGTIKLTANGQRYVAQRLGTVAKPVQQSVQEFVQVGDEHKSLIPQKTLYYPRKVDGTTDMKMLESYMLENKNVLLFGPTGSGKTSLVKAYCADNNLPYRRVSLNGGVTVEDLVGHWIIKDAETEWKDGVLTEAMKNGYVIVLDEINAASPEIMFVLNSVLDDDRMLVLTQKDGSIIKPHANFRVIATANPAELGGYVGAKEMNESLIDRFHLVLYLDYSLKAENKILDNSGLSPAQVVQVKELRTKLRQAYNNNTLTTPFSTRTLMNFASLLRTGSPVLIVNRYKQHEKKAVGDVLSTVLKMKIAEHDLVGIHEEE